MLRAEGTPMTHSRHNLIPTRALLGAWSAALVLGLTACGGPAEETAGDPGDVIDDATEVEETSAGLAARHVAYTSVSFDVFWGPGHTHGTTAARACSQAIVDADVWAEANWNADVTANGPVTLNPAYGPGEANYASCPRMVTSRNPLATCARGCAAASSIQVIATCPAGTIFDYYPNGCACNGPTWGGVKQCPNEQLRCYPRYPDGQVRGSKFLPSNATRADCITVCENQFRAPIGAGSRCEMGILGTSMVVIKTW